MLEPAQAKAPWRKPLYPPNGETFGYFVYSSGVAHGFLRTGNGTFATSGAPEAGTNSGQGTFRPASPALT
jgi:hypothetical protein